MSLLKSCPICGSNASMRTRYDMDGSEATWKFIKCNSCGLETPGKWFSVGNDCPLFYEEVRDQWNVRPVGQRLKDAEEVIAFYADKKSWRDSTDADHMFDMILESDLGDHIYDCKTIKTNSQGGKRAREYQKKYLTLSPSQQG